MYMTWIKKTKYNTTWANEKWITLQVLLYRLAVEYQMFVETYECLNVFIMIFKQFFSTTVRVVLGHGDKRKYPSKSRLRGGELAGAITHIPLTPSNDVFKVFFLQHQSLLRYAQKCFGRVMIFKIYIHFTPTPPPGKKITDIASN